MAFPEAVERVSAYIRDAGAEARIQEFPDGTHTAQDAADAVGCELAQIVKSLVFLVDGTPVMALVAGDNRLDEVKLAGVHGGGEVARADADAVRAATGFPIGGVPPLGHATELAVYIDEDLLRWDEVWAAAGTWTDVFPLAPSELVRVSGGVVADLASR